MAPVSRPRTRAAHAVVPLRAQHISKHSVAQVVSTRGARQRPWVASASSRCEQGGRWRRWNRFSCNGTILAPAAHVLARNAQNGSRWLHHWVIHRMCSPASFRLTSMRWKRSAGLEGSHLHASRSLRPSAFALLIRSPLRRSDRRSGDRLCQALAGSSSPLSESHLLRRHQPCRKSRSAS